ncbi:hypothetical protein E2C01_008945 [Portunus trituberculatus]|uniref:Uncharacterized protein n=1 Tax=Portunus trituberculatus TaxID=210409 RepID=A0A5B7D469_PORTR|nr:hypothetical protein [Portunus trituberculatus]
MQIRRGKVYCGQLKLKSLSPENSSASAQGLNTSSNSSSKEGFIAFIQQYLAMLWLHLAPTSAWEKTAQETRGTIRPIALNISSLVQLSLP